MHQYAGAVGRAARTGHARRNPVWRHVGPLPPVERLLSVALGGSG